MSVSLKLGYASEIDLLIHVFPKYNWYFDLSVVNGVRAVRTHQFLFT